MTLPSDGHRPPSLAPLPSARALARRPFGLPVVHAPTGTEAAAFDRHAIEALGVPQAALMENAGRGSADILERLYPFGRVLCLVGPGNNGGDGMVLARTLAARGRSVFIVLVGDRAENDALLHGWRLPIASDASLRDDSAAYDAALSGTGVLVDAILGTGLKGPPRARQAAAISAINRSILPVFSLDVPSGIDADGGAVPGEAVRATATVAFGAPKLGSLLHPARGHVGRLVALEIGFPPLPDASASDFPFGATLITPGWSAAHRPVREAETHKNRVGALLLLAGSVGMAGAAVFAARAAFRAGVGTLRVASAPENRVVLQAAVPEAIFIDRTDADALASAVQAADAIAAGPGMGTGHEATAALRVALDSTAPLLLDADALTLVGQGALSIPAELSAARPLLLTPHAGEMTRISSFSHKEIAAGRPSVARQAARAFGCTVLLKGTPSLVASPSGPLLVDTVGSSDLATAGMGDVLTGVAAAFLAQGLPPGTAAAVALHCTGGAASRAAKGAALTPSDVIDRLSEMLLEEGNGDSALSDVGALVFDQDPSR